MNIYKDKIEKIENFEAILADLKNELLKQYSEDSLSSLLVKDNNISGNVPVDVNNMSVRLGVSNDSDDLRFSFSNTNALAITGAVGSGKSNLMNVLISSFTDTENVEVSVISGGYDHKWCNGIVDDYVDLSDKSIDSLNVVENYLTDLVDEMNNRLMTIRDNFNSLNFWDLSVSERKEKGLDFIVVFIDNLCDISFTSNSGVSRAEKKVRENIDNLLNTLLNRCRSAGISFVISNQRYNEDNSINLLSKISKKIAFKINSDSTVRYFFGRHITGGVSPLNIPIGNPGVCVLHNGDDFSYVKVDYSNIK